MTAFDFSFICSSTRSFQQVVFRDHLNTQSFRGGSIRFSRQGRTHVRFMRELKQWLTLGFHFFQRPCPALYLQYLRCIGALNVHRALNQKLDSHSQKANQMGSVLCVVTNATNQLASLLTHVTAAVVTTSLTTIALHDFHHLCGRTDERTSIQRTQRMTRLTRLRIDAKRRELVFELFHESLRFLVK